MMSKKMAALEDDFREFKAHTERRCALGIECHPPGAVEVGGNNQRGAFGLWFTTKGALVIVQAKGSSSFGFTAKGASGLCDHSKGCVLVSGFSPHEGWRLVL
ncbi:hypothetical protein Tco_1368341 [Tanacetum coccineum]